MQLKAIALAFIWFLSIHFLVAQTIEKNKSTFGTKTQQNKKVIVLDRVIDTVVVNLNESDTLDQRNVEKVVTIELESEDESPSNAIKKYKIITRDEEDNVDEYEWTESVEGRIINEDKSNNTPRWIQKGDKGMKKNDRPRKLKRKIDGQAPRRDFNIEEEIYLTPSNNAGLGIQIEDTQNGVVITDILSDSNATKSGIRRGDTILKVGDKYIFSSEGLLEALNPYNANEEVKITVLRSGKEKKMKVKLVQLSKH